MHKILFVILFFALAICGNAQDNSRPRFPGGKTELDKYLKQQIKEQYGRDSAATVAVLFYVGSDGSILRPTVAISNPNSEEFENIALNIVKNMPRWTPAILNNSPQEMATYITLNFSENMKPKSDNIQIEEELISVADMEDFGGQISIVDVADIEDSGDQISIVDVVEIEEPEPQISIVDVAEIEEPVFDVVEEMPSFPGGNGALLKFVSENLRYPTIAVEQGIQGRLVLNFVVEKDGSLSNIKVTRKLSPECDAEAIRVIKMSPKWTPGKQNGQPARVRFTFPVLFKLP